MSLAGGLPSTIACGGCGTVVPPSEPYPFRCPNTGDGGDHVLRRRLDLGALEFPLGAAALAETHPFVRFRRLLHSYHLAVAGGLGDEGYVALVRRLDEAVARIDGGGFSVTPCRLEAALGERVGLSGPLVVKDETGNVSGSHKARHLFGVLLHLEVVERIGLVPGGGDRPPLAIASCGNAALAAAVVAAAGGRALQVFVPTDADPGVVARLRSLGASVTVCPREPGVAGDPTYHALQWAIAGGALPFTCQGNENGLCVEGGETLGWEIVSALAGEGARFGGGGSLLDSVVVQVGGGALASAVAASFEEAAGLGVLLRSPRLHTVQTASAWPLRRAFLHLEDLVGPSPTPEALAEGLRQAAKARAEFMWPWEEAPHSIAHGILDDETYDWLAVAEAMFRTGGRPVVVGEEELAAANALALETTGIPVDPTGSSGLAGLVHLVGEGLIGPGERAAVLFTGLQR